MVRWVTIGTAGDGPRSASFGVSRRSAVRISGLDLSQTADLATLIISVIIALTSVFLITALRQARDRAEGSAREIKASAERTRTILESISDAFYSLDTQWRYVYVNERGAKLAGRTREELLGQNVWQVFPNARDTKAYEELRRALAEQVPVHFEEYCPASDRWLEVDAYPSSEGLSVFARDTTERKRDQQARLQLAAIVESSDDAIIGKTVDGTIVSWNRGAEKIFGYAAQEVIGRPISILLPPRQEDDLPAIMERVLPGESIDQFETKRRRKDGAIIDVSLTISPIRSGSGEIAGASAVARDITERKQAEETLRATKEELELATDNMAAAVARCSRDRRYLWVSRGYAAWLRRPPQEITGKPIQDVIGAGGYEAIQPHIDKALSGRKVEYEAQVNFRGLGTRWIHAVYVPTFGHSHEADGWIAAVTDITERKWSEEERAQLLAREQAARTEAERANRLKDEFLAIVSHELRTPLTAILGWARMLRRGQADQSAREHAIEVIERNARSQAKLIEEVLDVSRIVSGKLRLEVRPVELPPVIEAAVDTMRPAAEANDIRLETVVDPHAGPVQGDPERLQQIVENLLSNAVKFTPKGGRVEVRLERLEEQVEITVTDRGAGIQAEFLPHVFEPFRQADPSTSRIHGGLGLGLAIVQRLTELHRGKVCAHSDGPGKGAIFTVQLPLSAADTRSGSGPDGEDIAAAPEAVPILSGVRVLVVEDNTDILDFLKALLERYGASVSIAASAKDALQALAPGQHDVLVCDIGLPDQDGYALIRQIRSLDATEGGSIPAIALTGYARAEDREQALAAGFQLHLAKPVDPLQLARTIEHLIRSRLAVESKVPVAGAGTHA